MERDARLVNWQPETIEQAEKVNARHLALYGIEYDSAPDGKGCGEESGGADLIGETIYQFYPTDKTKSICSNHVSRLA